MASGADEATVMKKIDIGGISLIRAAKNYNDVVIVASQLQYKPLLDMLMEHGATSSLEERRWMAKEALQFLHITILLFSTILMGRKFSISLFCK